MTPNLNIEINETIIFMQQNKIFTIYVMSKLISTVPEFMTFVLKLIIFFIIKKIKIVD